MHPIPKPEVLDPDRVTSDEREDMTLDEHRSRAHELDQALHDTAEYAMTLWNHLDAVRTYLFDSLPSDPRQPGPEPRTSASPTGPDDKQGWEAWIATYAAVTSVLAGAHGDSGFGLGEAQRAAELRRSAPNLRLVAVKPETAPDAMPEPLAPPPSGPSAPAKAPEAKSRPWRAMAVGALAALALRGVLAERRLRNVRP